MLHREEPDPKKRRVSDEHAGAGAQGSGKHAPIKFEARSARGDDAAGSTDGAGSGGGGGGSVRPPRPDRPRSRR